MRDFLFFQPKALTVLMIMLGVVLFASCGREAPFYEPGTIEVTSTPPGAHIFFDGEDTGEVTPYIFLEVPINRYIISVALENHFPNPTSSTVDLHPLERITRDFDFSSQALTVLSNPAGASIFLDGEDSGETTPATIFRQDPGDVEVQLAMDGMYISPSSYTASIVENEITTIPVETFTLRSKKTVMIEGFSSVNCNGCPLMADNVEDFMHQPGYGLDRALYCKFSMYWPAPLDPHFLANPGENTDRKDYYQFESIPLMVLDGAKVEGPPSSTELEALVDTALLMEPGFLIDVVADFSQFDVPVAVTLTAMQDVDISGCSLYIALVQSFLEYDTPPGSENETVFHWLFRDRVDSLPQLDFSLTTHETIVFNETLVRSDWDLDTMHVIAFVQDNSTKTVLQAGITATHAAASNFIDNPAATNSTPGDNRP